LPDYIHVFEETYKNTRSKVKVLDKEYNEIFYMAINGLLEGRRCKSRQLKEDRQRDIDRLKLKLPSNIQIKEESYISAKEKAKFINLNENSIFEATPDSIRTKLKRKPKRTDLVKRAKRSYNRTRYLEKIKKNLPPYLTIHEDTFIKCGEKAKFTDLELNIDYWTRCGNKISICKERAVNQRKSTELEIQSKLNEIYNGEVKIIYETYKCNNKVASFYIKDRGIVKYVPSLVLTGFLYNKRNKYGLWAQLVKSRDNFQCQFTGKTDNLHSHHIWSKAENPELETETNNGITLHKDIHREFHTIYGNKNNKAQILEFAASKGIDLSERLKSCPN